MRETGTYGLTLWESTDTPGREVLNGNFARLDGALAGLLVFGSYSGNGAASRSIVLGFQPRAVYVCSRKGMAGTDVSSKYIYGGLILPALPLQKGSSEVAGKITSSGFDVYMPTAYTRINLSSESYAYFAVR